MQIAVKARLCSNQLLPSYDFIVDLEDYRFQYRSHLIIALISIAKAHPSRKAEIREKLLDYLEEKSLTVTMAGPIIRFDNTETFRRMVEEL